MRQQTLKSLCFLVFTLLCLGTLLTTLIRSKVDNNNVVSHRPPRHKKSHPPPIELCKRCKKAIEKVKEIYPKTWKKQEYNYQKFRLQLSSECNGFDKAIITQANTPVGSKIVYDGEKRRSLNVTSWIVSIFAKEHPFQNKTRDTCAVVGNGGILSDSSCGKMIDSAQFVIRCNLPPLKNGYEEDVGIKTDLVTANPTILKKKLQLSSECNGFDKAIITQANTPVGSKIVYDGEKRRSLNVTSWIFSIFAKEHPFQNKTRDTCAVVGNGGILSDSSCGKMIDSAQFVIRCNLPPLKNGYEEDVGIKTDLVTANPTILKKKYGSLNGYRRPFMESLRTYGNSLLLLPAFSFGFSTSVCLRTAYTTSDFGSPIQSVFFNPAYLQCLTRFWRARRLREARLSSGLMMVSLALELCTTVHLYGFWPFSNHPHGHYALTNHYYDDKKASGFHSMPAEFDLLLQLHSQGVLRLHLGDCKSGEK